MPGIKHLGSNPLTLTDEIEEELAKGIKKQTEN